MFVYPRSYGDESDLEIIFPDGAVEKECRLTVQLIPPGDLPDITTISKDECIYFPMLRVSGQDKPFLEPVEVVLGYSCARVADINETFLPVGKKLPFTSKYGVMRRNHENYEGNDDRTATIERSQNNRLWISFTVLHFSENQPIANLNESNTVESTGSRCQKATPKLKAICLATQELDSRSHQKVSTVIAPANIREETEIKWGSEPLLLKDYLVEDEKVFFCIPWEQDHLNLDDNNIRFDKDEQSWVYNRVKHDETLVGMDMLFSRKMCVDNQHYNQNYLGKCEITTKIKNTYQATSNGQDAKKRSPAGLPQTSDSSSSTSSLQTSTSAVLSSDDGQCSSIPDDQRTKALKKMEHRCERFLNEVERLSKKKLKLIDDQNEESAHTKNVCDAASAAAFLFGIGGGLAIAMGVTTFGVGSFAGAAAVTATLMVKKIDKRKNKGKAKILEKCLEDERNKDVICAAHFILTIIKEAARELSRIFEHQLFELENSNDVTMMANCAVNLMLKLKDNDKFSRNSLLRKVFLGSTDKQDLKTRRNRQKWKVPDVLQKPGLRRQILDPAIPAVKFEYFSKPGECCEPKMYGYRGEILEMVCNDEAGTNVSDNDFTSSCCSLGTEGTSGKVYYFIECDIDKEYTEPCEEANEYSPFHFLVKCPGVLERFAASRGNPSRPSLRNYVSRMYYPSVRRVKPVYRSHSCRILGSLSNTDLSGSDFSRVHLTGSSLADCDFCGCIILFGELKNVNLCRSRFTNTQLSHCNLTGATAQQCEWTATDVLHSCLDCADLRGCSNMLGGNKWIESSLENAKRGNLPCEESRKRLHSDESAINHEEMPRSAKENVKRNQVPDVLVRKIDFETRTQICSLLDVEMPIENNDGRMLGEKIGLKQNQVQRAWQGGYGSTSSPTAQMLQQWGTKNDATLEKLREILVEMGREDVTKVIDEKYPQSKGDAEKPSKPKKKKLEEN